MMHSMKMLMLLINITGGTAVLGSYLQGILAHPHAAETLWGGVPQSIRPFYTAGMFLAAAGYFAFTYFILFLLDPRQVRISQRFGFSVFNALYAAILLPSALWMPLTFLAVEQSNLGLLWVVRIVLVMVGLASLGLLFSLLKVVPRKPVWAHHLAIAGSAAFCVQTVLLDAIVWVAYFHV
jgi:hypothetical protein